MKFVARTSFRRPISVTCEHTFGDEEYDRTFDFNFESKKSFQLKMLTDREEILLNNQDPDFMNTFFHLNPDIPCKEMQNSKSSSRFALSFCRQVSFTLTNKTNSSDISDESSPFLSDGAVETNDNCCCCF